MLQEQAYVAPEGAMYDLIFKYYVKFFSPEIRN